MKQTAVLAALFLSAAWGQVNFRYFYDGNGQLFRVLDSSGNLVEYDYDASGNPTAIRRSAVAAGSLAILNLAPQRGLAGAAVTIYGQNFSSTAASNTVMFNGVAATVISASSTALVVSVPNGVTTGPVSVTVNGTTVNSGTLNFTVPGTPIITSVSPNSGYVGETLTVTVQGSGLTDSTYEFLGAGAIGITGVNAVNDSSASFSATIGNVGGVFVLVGSGDSGPGSPVPTLNNTFRVFEPPGDNYASVRLSVFNTYYAPGISEPGVPAGSSAATQTLSVFNSFLAPGSEPGVPAGSNAATQTLSVFNSYLAPGSEPGVPPGSNAATQTLSVFNSYVAPGTSPGVPAGSNYAFERFSTYNSATGVSASPLISVTPLLRSGATGLAGTGTETAANPSRVVAGQTVAIDISSPLGFLPALQFVVNGATMASSLNGSLKTYFTVPYGVKSLTLQATGQTAYGQPVSSAPAEITVTPDTGLALTGRAVDGEGRPSVGAQVAWQANGLRAEYYQFNQSLSAIPDLTGLQPARTGYVSALNFPNPEQVFGPDPMGVGLGQNYAVRFSGKISIAAAGDYQFQLNAQASAGLRIDGAAVANGAGTALSAGEHDLEVIYYESGSGASVQLLWTPPGGVPGVVPPPALTTATSGAAAIAGADGRFRMSVPAALSGVRVVNMNGQGSVQLDQ